MIGASAIDGANAVVAFESLVLGLIGDRAIPLQEGYRKHIIGLVDHTLEFKFASLLGTRGRKQIDR